MATANPVMNDAVYMRAGRAMASGAAMTLQGTVVKTGILVAILLAAASISWTQASAQAPIAIGLMLGGCIGGFIVALITTFVPKISPITAPIYAALEGLFLGAVSAFVEMQQPQYAGIAIQALGLTVAILAIMLFEYGTGMIRATEKFKIGVIAATGAICLVYLVSMVFNMFGSKVPMIHDSGWVGIGFSVVVVVIAALNLILDFDFIEQGVARGAPKYMEWYGGFSLLVTLVWMYLEILRLLAKLKDNRS